MGAGKDAATWTKGWATRESRGDNPMASPTGTVQSAENPTAKRTLPKVASASSKMRTHWVRLTRVKSSMIFQAPKAMAATKAVKVKREMILIHRVLEGAAALFGFGGIFSSGGAAPGMVGDLLALRRA